MEARSTKSERGPETLSAAIVVEATLRLMDEHGVEWLSMRKLATELGVSAQALYWYFPSKDELCRAVVASAGEELGALPLGRGTPLERLERYLRELRSHWRAHPCVVTLSRRYPPTAGGAVAAQGAALLKELGFETDIAFERHRALIWIVLGFVYVEHSVTQSIHHQPIAGSTSGYQVQVVGASGGEPHALDTEQLFTDVLQTALRGLIAELND